MTAFGFGTPFFEQIEFFRKKLNLPTERWDDITRAAHDKAFVVAGAAKADLLADLRGAVDRAISEGKGIEAFRKDFRGIVQKHGWTGWTGEGSARGRAWRSRVIYQTNMATSYAAGRWRQLTDPGFAALRPYWRYVHADGVIHPRPHHLAWGRTRLTLRHDHPWWKTHFPPNGWGCHCYVVAVAAPEPGDVTELPGEWDNADGIDDGFAYAPGAAANEPLYRLVDDKCFSLEAPIGARMWKELAPALIAEQRNAVAGLVDAALSTWRAGNESVMAYVLSPRTVAALEGHGIVPSSAGVWLRDADVLHALRDSKAGRGDTLPAEVWRTLPDRLNDARIFLENGDLIFLIDADGVPAKIVVQLDKSKKFIDRGVRRKESINLARSGAPVSAQYVRQLEINPDLYPRLEQ